MSFPHKRNRNNFNAWGMKVSSYRGVTMSSQARHEHDRNYFKNLMSETCACSKGKAKRKSFCFHCYRQLPRKMQRALYKRIGLGYEQAYEAALEYLNEAKTSN